LLPGPSVPKNEKASQKFKAAFQKLEAAFRSSEAYGRVTAEVILIFFEKNWHQKAFEYIKRITFAPEKS
jgi:hypothetical protein